MASVIWMPPPGEQETAAVRVGEIVYTFSPGVAEDVPVAHLVAVRTALAAVEADTTLTSPALTSATVGGKTATRYFQVVRAGATAPTDAAPSAAATSAVCWTDADETITWDADLTETVGYKILYSPDNIVAYTQIGTVAHGAALSFVTTPAVIAAGTAYVVTAVTATTSTGTVTPNVLSRYYRVAVGGLGGDAAPGAATNVAAAPATLTANNIVTLVWTPPEDTAVSRVCRNLVAGTTPLTDVADVAHGDPQVALTFVDTGPAGTAYTATSGGAASGVLAGPAEI